MRWLSLLLILAFPAPLAWNGAILAEESLSSPPLARITQDGRFKQRPAWSPNGQWLAFTRHQGADIFLYVAAKDGSQTRRLTERTEPEFDAVWSPDGTRLAFAFDKTSPNQGDIEVYTIQADGTNLQPFATGEGKLSHEEWPAWSPDGRWIAYSSTRDGNQEIYVAPLDGGERKRLTNDPALDAHPCWSPDGKQIAFATDRWGDLELAVLEIETGRLTRLTESPGLDDYPAWSPDGRTIAFTSNRDGNLEIYLMEAGGAAPTNLTRNEAIDNFPTWTPEGRLTFVSNRDDGFDIYLQP